MAHEDDRGRRGRLRRVWLGVGALGLLALATYAVWGATWGALPPIPGFELSVQAVEDLIRSWGAWGALASIVLMILHSFVPFPAEIVAIANGMLYGPVWGTAITWSGAMLGAWLAFGLSRWLGRPFVLSMLPAHQHEAVDRWATQQGGGTLFFSRFVPVISFNLINYAAGLTAISWWTFTWATGLGILPLTSLMVLMGDRMWSGDSWAWVWLVLVAVVGWIVWHWWMVRARRRRSPGGPESAVRPRGQTGDYVRVSSAMRRR